MLRFTVYYTYPCLFKLFRNYASNMDYVFFIVSVTIVIIFIIIIRIILIVAFGGVCMNDENFRFFIFFKFYGERVF